ncbi:MAG: CsgG/HfaB family protein [Proteobacteria bacterium]|nr:CsgG/HfaB family protein [Pseudomonadota bacterium]MBU4294703.1 CsgG/HfaB family protein [Pseudomonadota bacterium]MCG2749788.1 CsgG/HfaB family protein [Desulfobulbaceae bacterium]
MHKLTLICAFCLLAVISLISGCAEVQVQQPAAEQSAQAPSAELPTPLAIFPFENNAVTRHEEYEPLTGGLAAMLITDLRYEATNLKIIERNRIKELLQEIDLSQSGYVDQATALRIGKLLGARSIAFGSFVVLGEQLRIDARLVNVETSETILAESISGTSDQFLQLEKKLAGKLAGAFQERLASSQASASVNNMNAALAFSKGLEALDRGDRQEAESYFRKTIELDPGFTRQVESARLSK